MSLLYSASAKALPQAEKEDLLLHSRRVLEQAAQVRGEKEDAAA